ncbi:hypothetical protein BJV77DRAFT_1153164 [Russula vinacea]|nr:hypothetical protein BJV77DRAFT_1153164 [Russula vinacea]
MRATWSRRVREVAVPLVRSTLIYNSSKFQGTPISRSAVVTRSLYFALGPGDAARDVHQQNRFLFQIQQHSVPQTPSPCTLHLHLNTYAWVLNAYTWVLNAYARVLNVYAPVSRVAVSKAHVWVLNTSAWVLNEYMWVLNTYARVLNAYTRVSRAAVSRARENEQAWDGSQKTVRES